MIANVSRRKFLQGASALGGLVLAVGLPASLRAADPPKYGADGMPHGWVDSPLVFVAIGEDGIVSIVCHRSEMGQGVRTGMPMIVADELEADWARVRVVQAPGDEARYGNQDTDGSRSTRHFFMPMRRCGAAARQMLEAAAAARWKVPVGEVQAKNGEVVHAPTGRRLGYGALAKAAASMPLPAMDAIRLKDPSQFRYIGTGKLKLVDAQDIVTGKAQYGMDTRLPGMLYAVVARPQVYGGKVVSVDTAAALKVPGVVRVVQIDRHAGCAAIQSARRRRRHRAQHLGRDAGAQRAEDRLGRRPECELRLRCLQGDARRGRAQAGQGRAQRRRLHRGGGRGRETHHGGILPSASRARVDGTAGGERSHRATASAKSGVASSRRRRRATWSPSGSACRSKMSPCTSRCSAADSAASPSPTTASRRRCCRRRWMASRSRSSGRATTICTTTTSTPCRSSIWKPASMRKGLPVAWLHRSVAPTIVSTFDASAKQEANWELGMGVINVPFAIPNIRIENPEAIAHTRIGWFRSVSNIPHAFAVQSFVAELAAAAGRDPEGLSARGDRTRARRHAADAGDTWNHGESPERYPVDTGSPAARGGTCREGGGLGQSDAQGQRARHRRALQFRQLRRRGGRGRGRCQGRGDDSARGHRDRLRRHRQPGSRARADAGRLRHGCGAAMLGEISFKNGRAQQDNFHQYEVTRIDAAPREIRVHIVGGDYDKPLGGVGEPGVPPIPPALCNAIFAATGKRIRAAADSRSVEGVVTCIKRAAAPSRHCCPFFPRRGDPLQSQYGHLLLYFVAHVGA